MSFLSLLINPLMSFAIISMLKITSPDSFCEIRLSSALSRIRVSNSLREPREICRKLTNSFLVFLAAPSAIFVGTDTPALRIWEVIPNLSSAGNLEVKEYNSFTNRKPFFHASRLWCGLIYIFSKSTISYLPFTIYN